MYHYSSKKLDNKLKEKILVTALISAIPFFLIAIIGYFGWEEITEIDYQVSNYFYGFHTPMRTIIMTATTHIGSLVTQTVVTVLAVVTLFIFKKWRTAIWYGLTVLIGAGILNGSVKELYGRARPTEIQPLVDIGGYSFPSGHSMGSVIVYGGILFLMIRFAQSSQLKFLISLLGFLMVLAVGISRIYLGVHFLTDVVAGFSLGFGWLCFSISVVGLKYTKMESKSKNPYSIINL